MTAACWATGTVLPLAATNAEPTVEESGRGQGVVAKIENGHFSPVADISESYGFGSGRGK